MIGREPELAELQKLLESVTASGVGKVAVVEGEAGIGKTALVTAFAQTATAAGVRRLRCAGFQREALAGFAALHELLHPVLDQAETLPPRQRAALLTAFGLQEGPAPDRLLISLAVLGLLEEVAASQPLLLLIEDAPWLDPSSAEVLGFLARRLEGAPILLVATVRTAGSDSAPAERGSEVLQSSAAARIQLSALSHEHSEQLLDTVAASGDLAAAMRRRVLQEAGGNPLALREFTSALRARGLGEQPPTSAPLPTTRRLEAAFLSEVADLPQNSRTLLLLAAAGEEASLPQLLTAGHVLGLSPQDLVALERADLVTVIGDRLQLRHPLLRSAVYGAASVIERAAAHRVLATAVTDSARAAWHRSAATFGRDESVAAALESSADHAAERGARAEAAAALRRAAELSPDPDEQVRRLIQAAELARQAGLVETVEQTIQLAEPLAVTPQRRYELSQVRGILGTYIGKDNDNTADQFAFAHALAGASGTDLPQVRARVLTAAAFGVINRTTGDIAQDAAKRREVYDALAAIDLGGWDDYQQLGLAALDPLGRAQVMRPVLPDLARSLGDNLPLLLGVGQVAEHLHDLTTARFAWATTAEEFNRSGTSGDVGQSLALLANLRLIAGQVGEARADGENARRMALDLGLPVVAAAAEAGLARTYLWAGRPQEAAAAVRRARQHHSGTQIVQAAANISWSAGLVALHERRYSDALAEMRAVGLHRAHAQWAVADLTEAAVRCGRGDEVEEFVAQVEHAAGVLQSGLLAMLVHRSRALLSDGPAAGDHFEAALTAGEGSGAPLEVARTHLLYGQWLRRTRRVLEARRHLGDALRQFEATGGSSSSLAVRATAELRAAGSAPSQRVEAPTTWMLTAQELQIAQLAAEGLTNKEIADRLYLSHRTVSSHLYRVFPKLGIAHRHQLRDALSYAHDQENRTSASGV
ncbi:helix-turn-helix transcriptional regulator [Kineococcus radiotolerans]|uniref:helix-turn-helix transcriptional regulator n=1 Tax=Kineococcus radiotolerans TaxID=131568 RepID=UPI00003A3C7E|nr:LuxR family transcriptional regulator [Kineococcus radiotolerans]